LKEVYVLVAFRYDKKRSIKYETLPDEVRVAEEVFGALKLDGADVISIRRVYEKCPIPKEQT